MQVLIRQHSSVALPCLPCQTHEKLTGGKTVCMLSLKYFSELVQFILPYSLSHINHLLLYLDWREVIFFLDFMMFVQKVKPT